jgi:MFS family permease
MSTAPDQGIAELHWKRNLMVCVFGAFTTIVAMTLLLPFLPLYVEHLGVSDQAAIVQWSGVAFGATFLSAALTAPLWGRLGDRYGRKLMLIRASLGMAVAMSLIGLAENIWQLVGLRLLAGCSAAMPRARRFWWRRKPRGTAPAGPWACCRRGSWPAIWPGR